MAKYRRPTRVERWIRRGLLFLPRLGIHHHKQSLARETYSNPNSPESRALQEQFNQNVRATLSANLDYQRVAETEREIHVLASMQKTILPGDFRNEEARRAAISGRIELRRRLKAIRTDKVRMERGIRVKLARNQAMVQAIRLMEGYVYRAKAERDWSVVRSAYERIPMPGEKGVFVFRGVAALTPEQALKEGSFLLRGHLSTRKAKTFLPLFYSIYFNLMSSAVEPVLAVRILSDSPSSD